MFHGVWSSLSAYCLALDFLKRVVFFFCRESRSVDLHRHLVVEMKLDPIHLRQSGITYQTETKCSLILIRTFFVKPAENNINGEIRRLYFLELLVTLFLSQQLSLFHITEHLLGSGRLIRGLNSSDWLFAWLSHRYRDL